LRIHLLISRLTPPLRTASLAAAVVFGSLHARGADAPLADGLYAEIETPRGSVTCELYFKQAPLTVANFVGLAEGSLGPAPRKPFFDGLKFHRVVPGFVVQGGDPLGTGEGGPGYVFPDEFVPGLRHDAAGVLSMANDGPDTNGSQFFLTLGEVNRLNYLHSVFGHAVRGLPVLGQIRQGDAMRVRILRIGAAAGAFRPDEASFAALEKAARRYTMEKEPGPAAHFDDPDRLLPTDPPRARNFNFKLGNFERATGVRLYSRLYARFAPEPGGENPGTLTQTLAKKLGIADNGAFAAYFADRDEWSLWIGPACIRSFTGLAETPQEQLADGSFHLEKHRFVASAREQAGLAAAEAAKSAPPGHPLDQAQRTKFFVDAILDGLILKLEPPR
jgi:cyclophilin family peptidyl-prolyl cis-trans isomerase